MTATPSSGMSTERTTLPVLNDTEVANVLSEYRSTATRAVRTVLGVSTDEEDLVQEALTRLVIRLGQPGEISVGAWTWRVAHNVAVDHLRTRRAVPTDIASLDHGVGDGLDTQVVGSELAAAISHGLAKLPDRQRDALLAQASLDGGRGGHAIVAANLGVSAKAAEGILARARRSLRRELDRMGIREGAWVTTGVVVLRGLRRVARPTAAVGGALTIAVVSVAATSVLVFHVPVLGRSSTGTPTTVHRSVSLSKSKRPGGPGPDPALATSRPVAPSSTGVGAPRPQLPLSADPPSPSISTRPGLSLRPVTVPGASQPTLPGATVPAVTLPPITAPGKLAVPPLPRVTLPTATIPTLPSVTLPAVPTVPALPPVLSEVLP